jgi:iron complex transport system permease protein
LAVVGVLGVSAGASGLSLGWLWGEAAGPLALVDLRLPRLLVAMLAGAMLAASGTIFQGVTRNPLASPDLMGVSQGAGLAALAALLIVPGLSLGAMQAAALAGGAGVLALVLLLAGRGVASPETLALTGIGVGAFCAAASSFAVAEAGLQVAQALVWLVGSTYGRSWPALEFLLPWAVLLLPAALLLGRWLDLLGLGDDAARSLGLPAARARVLLLAVATALAASAVAVTGTIAFVGLVAPHAAAMLCRGGYRWRLLVAALLGALLLGAADLIGRVALAPRELPAGLVTALLGAPYFLLILRAVNRAGPRSR